MAKILVLEDDNDLRNLYQRALSFRGHDVQATNSAENAIQLLDHLDYDVDAAVLDMSMPGLSGSAVVEVIRYQSHNPEMPIIVISCDDSFRTLLKNERVVFIAKPINLSDLYQAVSSVVS